MAGKADAQTDGDAHTDYAVLAPDPAWRDVVQRRVGYRMVGYDTGEHVGMPGTSVTCIISFDDPLTMTSLPDPAQSPTSLWTLIGGLHDAPAVISHRGEQHGLQLDLTPVGVRQLFGVPVAALGSSVLALDEVMGDLAGELWERSWSAGSWVERFAVVDEVFGRLRARHDRSARATVRPELRWVWHQVLSSGGAVRVDGLADELGWSRRHLADRFRAEFGVSVSTLRRLARFEAAVELLRDPRPRRLADVAATVGYADQAHLSREFRRLAGRSITEWWTEERFPFVHDDEPGAA